MTKSFSLLIAISFLFNSVSFSQNNNEPLVAPDLPISEKTKLITYSEVVQVEGLSAGQLFDKSLQWANGFYKNPKNVIRTSDKSNGKLVCKGRYRMNNPPNKKGVVTSAGDAMYKLTINFKDGRYKYEITEFNWMKTSAFPAERWFDTDSQSYSPVYNSYLQQTDQKAKEVIETLKATMSSPPEKTEEDW
jgi:hypothetical protein